MILTWILGLVLAWRAGWFGSIWFQIKLVLVVLLSGFHEFLAAEVRRFAVDQSDRGPRFFRIINEVPTLLMIAIVILVVIKPFAH
jgi:putative membrane protein